MFEGYPIGPGETSRLRPVNVGRNSKSQSVCCECPSPSSSLLYYFAKNKYPNQHQPTTTINQQPCVASVSRRNETIPPTPSRGLPPPEPSGASLSAGPLVRVPFPRRSFQCLELPSLREMSLALSFWRPWSRWDPALSAWGCWFPTPPARTALLQGLCSDITV